MAIDSNAESTEKVRERKTYVVPPEDARYMKECFLMPMMRIASDLIQLRWKFLSKTMGFDLDTVEIIGKGPTFTAVPLDEDKDVAR
jgi:hypothetical protein